MNNTQTAKPNSFKSVAHMLTNFLKKFSKEPDTSNIDYDLKTLSHQIKQQQNQLAASGVASSKISHKNNNDYTTCNCNKNATNAQTDVNTTSINKCEIDNQFVNSLLIASPTQSNTNPSIQLNANTSNKTTLNDTQPSQSQQQQQTTSTTSNAQCEVIESNDTPSTSNTTTTNQTNVNQNLNQPFQLLSSNIEPKFLLTIIQERLEAHKKEYGNRVKCVPSVRTINCQHHCVALLASRLFTILCNDNIFQQKLINDTQQNNFCFNTIVELLNPNNDPVS